MKTTPIATAGRAGSVADAAPVDDTLSWRDLAAVISRAVAEDEALLKGEAERLRRRLRAARAKLQHVAELEG